MRKDPKELRKYIQESVRLLDMLVDDGHTTLNHEVEQQISCPFHGSDSKPSARFYPESNSMYCFTCKKSWDVVSYVMEEKASSFRSALDLLVSRFNLPIDHLPDANQGYKSESNRYKRERDTNSKVDRKKLLMLKIEDRILKLREYSDPDTFGKVLFVMSHMRKTEDHESFTKMAGKVIETIKRFD